MAVIVLEYSWQNILILIKRLEKSSADQEIENECESNILLKDYKPSEMLDLVHFKSVTPIRKDRHFQMQSPPVCKTGGLKICY